MFLCKPNQLFIECCDTVHEIIHTIDVNAQFQLNLAILVTLLQKQNKKRLPIEQRLNKKMQNKSIF